MKCKDLLFALEPWGPTNIWDGIHTAMEVLRDPEGGDGGWGNEERRKAILLLTDGVPNREPNHGYVEGIRNYMD